MGLGRLAHGNKKPARGLDFSMKRLERDLADIRQQQQAKSVYRDVVDVVQSMESENDCS